MTKVGNLTTITDSTDNAMCIFHGFDNIWHALFHLQMRNVHVAQRVTHN